MTTIVDVLLAAAEELAVAARDTAEAHAGIVVDRAAQAKLYAESVAVLVESAVMLAVEAPGLIRERAET